MPTVAAWRTIDPHAQHWNFMDTTDKMAQCGPAGASVPCFELGLALAGGVSCGAFTAGVLDALIEALDAWHEAIERGDPEAPRHRLRIRVVGGASSGALNAAIWAAVMPYRLKPVRFGTEGADAGQNPFYDSWVNRTGLEDLLGSRDAAAAGVRSLLDPTPVVAAARAAIEHELPPRDRSRSWVDDRLTLLISVTNLQGRRFSFHDARPVVGSERGWTDHAEVLRFASTGGLAGAHTPPSPDGSFPLTASAASARWDAWGAGLAQAALASSALPGMLPARRIRRRSKATVQPAEGPVPASAAEPDEFDAVDGGIVDNDALAHVREALIAQTVPSSSAAAQGAPWQATLLIDPLLNSAARDRRGGADDVRRSPIRVVASVFQALLDQARARPQELALALKDDVYTHFLIAPQRDDTGERGPGALAGAALGGAGGYLSRDFRHHDFQLGRRNAQQALCQQLTVPAEHPLFSGWTQQQRERYAVASARGSKELPLVPLMKALRPKENDVEPLPDWPAWKADPAALGPAITARLSVLWAAFVPGWVRLLTAPGWILLVRPLLRVAIVRAMGRGLRAHGLQQGVAPGLATSVSTEPKGLTPSSKEPPQA